MTGAVRLVIAEDNLLVREGLVSLLATAGDFAVITACSSLDELYEAVERDRPDVVITDIRMPPNHRDEGIQAARRFRTTHPRLGVVVLSQFVDPAYALALLDDGTRGRGYVLKDRVDEVGRLAQAIRIVAGGGSFIDDDVVDALVRARTRMVDSPLTTLTTRELEVLAEMATGATNTAIAESLGVSMHSVEKHSTAIFVKLGLDEATDVNRRVMAVLMFLAGHQPVGPHVADAG
ncbi:MAG: putative NarL family two-component response regulator [Desertimonas sp.]|nr:putative NarL family two-component response regulator [Desertimonas sp.]